jgi:hypothetical protein
MKRTSVAAALALCALPLFAQTSTSLQPPPPVTADSPLVAAAKAANKARTNKKKIVITNDTLLRTGGHFTTTASQAPLPPLPKTNEAERAAIAAQQKEYLARVAAEAKAKKDQEAQRQRIMERAGAMAEGDYDEVVPAGNPNDPNLTQAERQALDRTLTPQERELMQKVMESEQAKNPPL